MTLENIYYVGQTVAVFAILVSLTFVVLQLRQTQQNQRSLINQGVATRDHEIMRMFQTPEIAAVYAKAMTTEVTFERTEIFQMMMVARAVLGQMQDAYVQKKSGLIDQDTYDFIESGVRAVFRIPLVRVLWPLTRPTVSPDAAALGDQFLSRSRVTRPIDDFPELVREKLSEIWNEQAMKKALPTST